VLDYNNSPVKMFPLTYVLLCTYTASIIIYLCTTPFPDKAIVPDKDADSFMQYTLAYGRVETRSEVKKLEGEEETCIIIVV
jgi:hypothetical protein